MLKVIRRCPHRVKVHVIAQDYGFDLETHEPIDGSVAKNIYSLLPRRCKDPRDESLSLFLYPAQMLRPAEALGVDFVNVLGA